MYIYIYIYVAKHPQPYHIPSFSVRPSTSPQSTYTNKNENRIWSIMSLSSLAWRRAVYMCETTTLRIYMLDSCRTVPLKCFLFQPKTKTIAYAPVAPTM